MSHAINPVNGTYMAQRQDYQVASISAKQIIEGINHAVTRVQRFQALQAAHRAFSHHCEEMHNYEIDLGAVNALCLKLGYILLQKHPDDDLYMEIELVCAVLCMVYRCSTDRRLRSFREIGYSDLMPLLIQVLHVTNDNLQPGSQCKAILRALHVLRVFSKLPPAKQYLIHKQSLWTSLITLVWAYESVGEQEIRDKDVEEVQLEVLAVFKDLTFRTTNEEKKAVYDVKGFVPTILHFGRKAEAPRLTECVASIWWNLAMSLDVGHEMTNSFDVLMSLHRLMWQEHSWKTRRNAISSLGNLATEQVNHERLLHHENGILVECLMKLAQDEDTDSRRRAMRTLRCLSSSDVAASLRRDERFGVFLTKVAKDDLDRDTRAQALECMANIVKDREAMNVMASRLTTALIGTIESSNDPKLTIDACRKLSMIFSLTSESTVTESGAGIHTGSNFYSKVANAISGLKNEESHLAVATLLSQMDEKNAFDNKVPPPALLNILATMVSQLGPDFEYSRKVAMSAIKALSEQEGNKKALAEDELLLTALVNYALATVDPDKKNEAKILIMRLVPEL